jgi:hypothetical protein
MNSTLDEQLFKPVRDGKHDEANRFTSARHNFKRPEKVLYRYSTVPPEPRYSNPSDSTYIKVYDGTMENLGKCGRIRSESIRQLDIIIEERRKYPQCYVVRQYPQ